MTPEDVRAIVQDLDTTSVSAEEEAWLKLKPLGSAVVPYLAEFYTRCGKWQGRASLLFHSIRFARDSEAAFQLGVEALQDKSAVVRYRACSLLAYSLRVDALQHLDPLLRHSDAKTSADAKAAIQAIRTRNHHLFVDRNRTGQSFWVVNPGDSEA